MSIQLVSVLFIRQFI